MAKIRDDIDWSLTTWEGVRREQLRRALRLTLRERLQGVEDMAELARYFQALRDTGRFRDATSDSKNAPSSPTDERS